MGVPKLSPPKKLNAEVGGEDPVLKDPPTPKAGVGFPKVAKGEGDARVGLEPAC